MPQKTGYPEDPKDVGVDVGDPPEDDHLSPETKKRLRERKQKGQKGQTK